VNNKLFLDHLDGVNMSGAMDAHPSFFTSTLTCALMAHQGVIGGSHFRRMWVTKVSGREGMSQYMKLEEVIADLNLAKGWYSGTR
jgi:hypothetical protein